MKSQERKKEKKFSRGGSSSGKRPTESEVDSVQVSSTRTQQDTRFRSRHLNGQEKRPACSHCHGNHYGFCRLVIGGCL